MELGNMIFGHSRGEHSIERGAGFEEEIARLFDAIDWDDEGYAPRFENAVFVVRPYFWGECRCPEDANEHADECPAWWPNFKHKPSGYELRWYKYPLRDSYANESLSLAEFRALMDACIATLPPLSEKTAKRRRRGKP